MSAPPDPSTVYVQAAPTSGTAWTNLAREAERLGLGGLYVADHPGSAPSPFVALAAAAAVTERITLGTCVVNAGLWHPIDLASAVATLDLVSDGRAILGLGAGHTPAEWTARGRTPPSGTERIARLEEVVVAVRALLDGGPVSLHGAHVVLDEARLDDPLPPGRQVPLMIGGNGPRLLEVAARHAEVVGVTGLGRTLPDGHRHTVDWAPKRVADTIAKVRATGEAADRRPSIEALVQRVEITDDADRAARSIADAIEGATAEDLLAAPYVWLGTVEEIRAELTRHREVTGIDRWVVRDAMLPALREILGVD